MQSRKQNIEQNPASSERWFYNLKFDLSFFHIPIWLGLAFVLFFAPKSLLDAKVPIWAWVSIILIFDVGHVWATIYRTYWDREARKRNRDILIAIPLVSFVVGFGVAYISTDLFWTVLAYIAVFHFVKQQYGITALYHGRMFKDLANVEEEQKEDCKDFLTRLRTIDQVAIYTATLFPILYWHIHLPKKIWWFSEWDFLPFLTEVHRLKDTQVGFFLYQLGAFLGAAFWIGTIVVWLWAHREAVKRFGVTFPLGKFLWVLGTYVNWFVGIVYLDSPFAFTLTNVIAHGVPYVGLVYIYTENAWRGKKTKWFKLLSKRAFGVLVFLVSLLFFAFWEEFFWDTFVRGGEYKAFFNVFLQYPFQKVKDPAWFAFWMALLSVPQLTHYFLDRYIWKPGKRNPHLKDRLSP